MLWKHCRPAAFTETYLLLATVRFDWWYNLDRDEQESVPFGDMLRESRWGLELYDRKQKIRLAHTETNPEFSKSTAYATEANIAETNGGHSTYQTLLLRPKALARVRVRVITCKKRCCPFRNAHDIHLTTTITVASHPLYNIAHNDNYSNYYNSIHTLEESREIVIIQYQDPDTWQQISHQEAAVDNNAGDIPV